MEIVELGPFLFSILPILLGSLQNTPSITKNLCPMQALLLRTHPTHEDTEAPGEEWLAQGQTASK